MIPLPQPGGRGFDEQLIELCDKFAGSREPVRDQMQIFVWTTGLLRDPRPSTPDERARWADLRLAAESFLLHFLRNEITLLR